MPTRVAAPFRPRSRTALHHTTLPCAPQRPRSAAPHAAPKPHRAKLHENRRALSGRHGATSPRVTPVLSPFHPELSRTRVPSLSPVVLSSVSSREAAELAPPSHSRSIATTPEPPRYSPGAAVAGGASPEFSAALPQPPVASPRPIAETHRYPRPSRAKEREEEEAGLLKPLPSRPHLPLLLPATDEQGPCAFSSLAATDSSCRSSGAAAQQCSCIRPPQQLRRTCGAGAATAMEPRGSIRRRWRHGEQAQQRANTIDEGKIWREMENKEEKAPPAAIAHRSISLTRSPHTKSSHHRLCLAEENPFL
ncbi:hypothetical protein DAI22_02g110901 [Oryza sativa Japonica Group]|nr:hypothetical protein DAI22_02g110901 [Oryza sativa Japonica Group]